MFKNLLLIILIFFLFFSCSKKKNLEIEPTNEEMAMSVYKDAIEALKAGQAFYANKKFKEVESLLGETEWAAKASLLAAYSDYTRNSYSKSIFALKRHIKNYPADKNIPYANYLIAICYYEQILDEKKDLDPLLKAKSQFEFIASEYSDTDYAIDARFKLNLILDQLAAKEMSIARFYMKTEKWIPALNRLKIVVDNYDKTVFVEEALHRLVEVYYKIGLIEESKKAATILGYNYLSGEWYARSYKVFNRKYTPMKNEKKKDLGLVRKTIKKLFN